MQKAYQKIVEKAQCLESQFGSLENFAVSTNFESQHRMKMRGFLLAQCGSFTAYSFFQNKKLKKELDQLELADLCDLQKIDGEFDGEFV